MDHEGEHSSRWAAVASIAAKIGCSAHTLLDWVKKAGVDKGKRAGIPTDFVEKLKARERENHELRQANEILRKAAYKVESICKVLLIARSTYFDHVAKRADPEKLSFRAKPDAVLQPQLIVFKENFRVYGVRKVWRQLRQERCDVPAAPLLA